MYPDFQYLLEDIFAYDMPSWLSFIKTFGFFVAVAFIVSSQILTYDIKRMEAEGKFNISIKKKYTGKRYPILDSFLAFLIGFIVGYAVCYLIMGLTGAVISAKETMRESILVGVVMGLSTSYLRLSYQNLKEKHLPSPETKAIMVYPHQMMSEILILAAVSGLIGAKVFNAFETWDDFINDPIGNLFSTGGLTFYGGLIFAFTSVYFYTKKHKISFRYLCDAAAPVLMLAYAIGRLGCHFAGDGDWGIINSAYVTSGNGSLSLVSQGNDSTMKLSGISPAGNTGIGNLFAHVYFPAPIGLPDWVVASNYPHNVINDGIVIEDCHKRYCHVLPFGVFPTPLYEFIICFIMAVILWTVRKRFRYPLQLFGLYLIMNATERFFIEKIRVNYKYDWGFIYPTQAEIISTLLFISGLYLIFLYSKNTHQNQLKHNG